MKINDEQKQKINKILSGAIVEDSEVEMMFLTSIKPIFMLKYKRYDSVEFWFEAGNQVFKAYITEDGSILYITRVGCNESD